MVRPPSDWPGNPALASTGPLWGGRRIATSERDREALAGVMALWTVLRYLLITAPLLPLLNF